MTTVHFSFDLAPASAPDQRVSFGRCFVIEILPFIPTIISAREWGSLSSLALELGTVLDQAVLRRGRRPAALTSIIASENPVPAA